MARARGGDKLVCQHNGWVWVDWQLLRLDAGWALVAGCSLGDHYIQQDGSVDQVPYCWPSQVAAVEAWDAWRAKRQKAD